MNFTMTIRQALEIQAKQVKHYAHHRADLAEVVASKTNIEGYDIDKPMSVIEINRLVPRGGEIEYMCGLNFSD